MKSVFAFFLILLFIAPNYSQTMETIYLYPDKVPNEKEEKHDSIVSADHSNNVTRLADVTNPAIMVFKPKETLNNGAAILVCPGGGYNILAIDLEGYEIAKWLNAMGFTAFVLQYRVPNKQLGALNDVQRAIKIIRSKSDLYKFNTNKLGLMGFSAGASLAARASTLYDEKSYADIDDIDLLSSRPDFALLIYPAYLDMGENNILTPELDINGSTPPMFLFATADDPYANSSLVMVTALRNANIPVELHLLAKGGHGYGLRLGNIAAETWPKLAENWLNKVIEKE